MSKYFPYNTHSPFVHIENSFIVLLGLVYENIYWQDIMRDHLFLNRRYSLQTYQSCYSVLSKKPSRGVSHSYLKKTSNIPTNMSYIPWTIIEQIYPLNDYWKLLLLQIHDYSHLWLNSIREAILSMHGRVTNLLRQGGGGTTFWFFCISFWGIAPLRENFNVFGVCIKTKNLCWSQRGFLKKKMRNFDEFLLSGAGQSCDVILPWKDVTAK